MREYFLLFMFFLLLSSSCRNEVVTTIEGSWSIDTIYYKNYDVKNCLYVNIIDFKKDGEASFPYSGDRCKEVILISENEFGNWKIINSSNVNDTLPFRIKIVTENQLFTGTHKIVFYKDEPNKLLKMEIWSDSLYIVCRKGLFNYDKNIDLINRLEKISWITRP
jgi:hemin uptake protein HemP